MRNVPIVVTALLFLLLLLLPACGGPGAGRDETGPSEAPQSAADLAIEELKATYEALESPAEKVALLEGYLDRFPDTEHTKGVVRELAQVLSEELERPDEAQAAIEEALAGVEDRENRRYVEMELAIHHANNGQIDELKRLAAAMAREYDFRFTDHYQLMESATEAAAWELVIEQADAAMAFATPAAYKAQYPDMSDELAERNGRRRVAYAMAFKGWALANLGRAEEAMAAFESARSSSAYSLLGADETPLHLYWGMSLLETGDAEGALEKLSAEAVHGFHPEGPEVFREAWIQARGGEEGLEERLWELRLERAVDLPEFALADYQGETLDTSRLAGDVILVAAWHPT